MRTQYFAVILILALLCSGFTWGKSSEQNCTDVNEMINNQQMHSPNSLPDDLEHKVNKLCPGGVSQKFLEGLKLELHNETDQAITIYENIIKVDDHFPDAHGRLGLLQLARGNKAVAMFALTNALENGGKNPNYHLAMAKLLLETHTYPLVLYHYDKSLALGRPHDVPSLVEMAKAYSGMKNWKEAESVFRQAIYLSPNDPKLKSELAQIEVRHRP